MAHEKLSWDFFVCATKVFCKWREKISLYHLVAQRSNTIGLRFHLIPSIFLFFVTVNNEVYLIHKVTLHCRFVVKHAEITFFSIKQTTYIVHSFVRHPFFIHSLSCSQLQIRFSCVGSERFMRLTKLGAKINFFSLAIINIVQTIICHIRASTIIEIEYQKCVSTLIRLHGVLTWEKLYEKFHRYRLVDWLQFWLWNFSVH